VVPPILSLLSPMSLAPCHAFVMLPFHSRLDAGLPNGALVCLLLCILPGRGYNADRYGHDRMSCCLCERPFVSLPSGQTPHCLLKVLVSFLSFFE